MIYWTYSPEDVELLNEKLRIKIAEFPKGKQSQKQASSHYDGYNHYQSLNINHPEFQQWRDYASRHDPDTTTGYVDLPRPQLSRDPHQQYKTIFWEGIAPLIHKFARDVAIRPESGLNYQIFCPTMWFHQMSMGDYDNWHNHYECQWVGVYYVDLPEGEETEFMDFDGKVEQVKVKEGELLIFPSGYLHRSPPKMVDDTKTIISIDFNIGSKYSKETLARLKETHPENYFEDIENTPEFKV